MSGFGYNVLGFGANASSGGEVLPSDDQFNRVSFLSHFDGSNDGVNNVFIDGHDTSSPHTITANGDVTQGSFGPFARPDGEWAVSFDGDGDYLTVADSTEFDFGTGNFTIEGWINTADISSFLAIFSIGSPVQIYSYNNSIIAYFNDQDNTSSYTINGLTGPSSSVSANTWAHFAVVRNGNTFTAYVNGVAGTSATSSDTVASSSNAPAIGTYLPAPTTYEFNGYISNLRLVKGTAVYTSNFTPSTSKLTAITNTKLLTCQSNRFLDNSASGHAITPTDATAVSAFGPFLTSAVYDPAVNGASAYFDGTGDYLDANDGVTFGTGEFTIEFFVYLNKLTQQFFFDARPDSVNTVYPVISVNSNDTLNYYANSGNRITSSTSEILSKNAWHHIAVCRSGTSTKMFLDGTQVGSTYSDSTNYADSGRMRVGATKNATNRVEGYMSDVRVVNSALYTGNFTPPTAPLTAITNTKLLLNMADGQAIDSAAQRNIKLKGTAKTSTTEKKFGDTSIYLSGSGNDDYVKFDTLNGPLEGLSTTSPATIEGYFNWNGQQNSGGFRTVIGINRLSDGANTLLLYCGNSSGQGILGLRYSAGSEQVLDSSIAINTWHHFAMVLNNGSYKFQFFLNGTSVYTNTSVMNVALSDCQFLIGAEADGSGLTAGDAFTGYIDEIRVSQMARYTSNFTVPSEPFPDKGQ
tara:strand:+ start:780 stop:2855 length:2076 start_codon:yes stop_codon:yes gene_type:complete